MFWFTALRSQITHITTMGPNLDSNKIIQNPQCSENRLRLALLLIPCQTSNDVKYPQSLAALDPGSDFPSLWPAFLLSMCGGGTLCCFSLRAAVWAAQSQS